MTPAEFSVRLQRGITGGFAPPTPSAIYTLTRPLNADSLNITTATRPIGTPSLVANASPLSLFLTTTTTTESPESLVNELHTILKSLPLESPPGSQDIYGMDTSIAWGSDDLMWCNGGPSGCGGGQSMVQATEEDKVKFKRAVEIVDQLVGEAK